MIDDMYIAVLAMVGLLTGSFMNVVVYRLPLMMESDCPANWNIAWPPSHCPHCQHRLRYGDTIPLLSWLLLRGRCRDCQQPVPLRYPLTEVLCGVAFAIIAALFPTATDAFAVMVLFWFVLALAQIDARTYLLPDRLTQPLIWLGLLYHGLCQQDTLTDALFGAVAGYLSLWLVWWIYRLITGKEGLGLGDAKLLAALGAWCGWQALSMILLGASLMGIGCWIVLRLSRGTQVPHIAFGPWLGLAGLIIFTMQLLGVEIY